MIEFKDEFEEHYWIILASGITSRHDQYGGGYAASDVAAFTDNLLLEFRKRQKKKEKEGPYR